jgi:hypothetical protein
MFVKYTRDPNRTVKYPEQRYIYINYSSLCGSRGSAVGIVTGYWLNDREVGVRVPVRPRIFTSPRRPDRLRGPPNLLSNGYQGLFPRG